MAVISFGPERHKLARGYQPAPIVVGLVNNMPDAAVRSTERQFRELLAEAAGERAIVVRTFSLPGLPRSTEAQLHVCDHHEEIAALWSADLDGLIVTGTEPRAASLVAEPYWPALTRLVDWAAEHTIATVWSCLAAHAAALYLDGIERREVGAKLSGVFECVKTADHWLVEHAPVRWHTPHSRYNELPEEELLSRGYQILARAPAAGADLFVKRGRSLFVFLQGHPEYDAGALFREYRRDVGRFLAGERQCYPETPCGYLGDASIWALFNFREQAMRERDPALASSFPAIVARNDLQNPWREAAVRLYANWLSYLAAEKALRIRSMIQRRSPRMAAAPAPAPAYG